MAQYRVTWEIELDADTPEDAAREALAIMRDPDSIATVFTVHDQDTATRPRSTPANTRRQTMSAKVQEIVIDLDDPRVASRCGAANGRCRSAVVVRGPVCTYTAS